LLKWSWNFFFTYTQVNVYEMRCNDDDDDYGIVARCERTMSTNVVVDHPNEDVVEMLNANSMEQWKKDPSGGDVAEIEVTVQNVNPLAASSEQQDVSNRPTTTTIGTPLENGITIVVVMPLKLTCKMLSFTKFDPNHVPRAILSSKLSITVEDYVTAMELLTNDFRFRLYTVFHQRIIFAWLIASLIVMLCVLFSNARGLVLFALSLSWSFVIGLGTLLCVIFERMLDQSLSACVATVNRFLVRHNLLLCVDDRGKFSCHKIAIVFLYFNLDQCILEVTKNVEKIGLKLHRQQHHLPIPTTPSVSSQVDIVAAPTTAQNKENAKRLILQHTQRYCRDLIRQGINLPVVRFQDQTDDMSITVKHCKFAFIWKSVIFKSVVVHCSVGLCVFCLLIFKKIMSTEKDNPAAGIISDKTTAVDGELLSEILGMQMESMLTAFQSDLGNISNEIQSLQEQSVKMSVKLKNRQAVRGELSQFIDEIVVPEVMIKTIIDEPVSERLFLEQLHELQHKIAFVKQQAFREALSCVEVEGLLENLRLKATEKTRDFLLKRIYQFRKPMANYPVTQGTLLKYRFYFEFILSNDRYVAKEIRDEYVNTTSKIFYTYFKTYASRLMKLQLDDVATKDDLLGSDDSTKMVNMFSTRPNVRNRATVFSLGSRMSVLKEDLEAPIIVPHAADQNKQKIIRRYGEFFAALAAVNADLPDEKLQQYLYRLENEVAHLLARAMHEFKSIRERTIFLINNYDLIVSVLMEKLPGESIDSQESSKRLQAYITEYAELLLTTHFGSLYYHRLHKVLAMPTLNHPARNELVNIHNLMVEVKKYKPMF
ncbi:Vacuolar protein sorting-associated protein 52 -like protein, partial [Trichinella patagoniensis]